MGDYFKPLWDGHVERSSVLDSSGVLHGESIELFITLPASWPLYARLLIFEAFREAGMLSDDARVFPKCISSLEVTAVAHIADLTKLTVVSNQRSSLNSTPM